MKHICKYWKYNIRRHHRWCVFCGRNEYDYGGKWKPQISLEQFINIYSSLGGTDTSDESGYDLTLQAGLFFEFNTYENWGTAIKVTIEDKTYGPFPNLNAAEYAINESRRKEQEEASVDGSRIRDSQEI